MQKESYRELTEHGTAFLPVQTYSFQENYDRFFVSHHWHEEVELLYLERGDFLLERNMEPEELGEGTLVFLNRSELHQLTGRSLPSIHHAVVFIRVPFRYPLSPLPKGERYVCVTANSDERVRLCSDNIIEQF